jgi:hypothetical protein
VSGSPSEIFFTNYGVEREKILEGSRCSRRVPEGSEVLFSKRRVARLASGRPEIAPPRYPGVTPGLLADRLALIPLSFPPDSL